MRATWNKNLPALARKGDSIYYWSIAGQKWKNVSPAVDMSGYAPASGSYNYIQNQYASKQTANAWFDTVDVVKAVPDTPYIQHDNTVSILEFGAVGDGVTNNLTA